VLPNSPWPARVDAHALNVCCRDDAVLVKVWLWTMINHSEMELIGGSNMSSTSGTIPDIKAAPATCSASRRMRHEEDVL
jgi:hypothetical protein